MNCLGIMDNMNKKPIEFNKDTDVTINYKGRNNSVVFNGLIMTNIEQYQSLSEKVSERI